MSAVIVTPGDLAQYEVTFTNLAGAPTDPPVVELTVTKPDGSTVSPTISKTGTGVYKATETPSGPHGSWYWRWYGHEVAAVEGFFIFAKEAGP